LSNPTSEQSPFDAPQPPQQPYGAPQQPAYGEAQQPAPGYAPPQQFGAPQSPYGVPQGPQTNGLATAGLVLGILPTGPVGLIFSILGIVRAGKVGGVGRTKAWVGLVLSILWIAGYIAGGVAVLGSDTVKNAVTCSQTEVRVTALGKKSQADASNPTAFKKDLQDIIDELNSSANKMADAKKASDMRKAAADFKEVLDDLNSGTAPSADLQSRLGTDGAAVDTDCS
jgi:hypothetical protein